METLRPEKIRRFQKNWQNEVDSAAQYSLLSKVEERDEVSNIYLELAKTEERHAEFWEKELIKVGVTPGARTPSWRSRVLIFLAKRFGTDLVLPTICDLEKADRNVYVRQKETLGTKMTSEEHQHARILEKIGKAAPKGVEGSFIARIEGRHRNVGGNALRAGVLGVNDGLCSNLSLVMGVMGLSVNSKTVLLTGLAGLCAGACSMAMGEWISVTSSEELARNEMQIEADELEADPESEREELKLIYEAKGLTHDEATELSLKMINDPDQALNTLAREELGIDPSELGGRPLEAAGFSFALFSVGAIIPIAPLFFIGGGYATLLSLGLSSLALFGFGAFITVFTGQSIWISGLRQVGLGLGAALLTFGVGHLLHVSIS